MSVPTAIFTLSLHDALPICSAIIQSGATAADGDGVRDSIAVNEKACCQCVLQNNLCAACGNLKDRKSTRLNSSHTVISYAVFCLKKKKTYIPLYGTVVLTTL